MSNFCKCNFSFLSLFLVLVVYISTGSAFQCPRHTSRYSDVPSLCLTSSLVLSVKPVMTSRNYVISRSSNDIKASSNICYVTVSVRKVYKDTTEAFESPQSTGDGRNFRRIRVGFCMENQHSYIETEDLSRLPSEEIETGTAVKNKEGLISTLNENIENSMESCMERIFPDGSNSSYLVFLDRTQRVANETEIQEFVSLHQPVIAEEEKVREAKKYSCSKQSECSRKPSAKIEPEFHKHVGLKQQLEINCRISGSPQPEVEWIRNGDVMDITNTRFKIRSKKRGSLLRIRKALSSDCGEYYCRAVNVLGESTSHSLYVTIGGEVSCPAQHKHPCSQQTYCLHGGTCWVLTTIGTEFCTCQEGYQGERCAEKIYMPSTGALTDRDKILMVSIVSIVLVLALLGVSVCVASRKCSAQRRKRYSRDFVDSRDSRMMSDAKIYRKLDTDTNSNTLKTCYNAQLPYTDEKQTIVRDQAVQTVLSLSNSRISPLIHVQIQSAIIQPSESLISPSLGQGLDHADSIGGNSSSGRGRLSAISMTPAADLDRQIMRYGADTEQGIEYDEVDYLDISQHLEEMGIHPIKTDDRDILRTMSSRQRSHTSPLTTLEKLPNDHTNKFFQSPEISRNSGISSPLESLKSAEYEKQRLQDKYRDQNENFPNRKHKVLEYESREGMIQRNISNPDILESVQNGYTKVHSSPSAYSKINEIKYVEPAETSKEDRKINNDNIKQDSSVYDSDPEATVV